MSIELIKRIGKQTSRLTWNRIYKHNFLINAVIDDNGNSLCPCLHKPGYWVDVTNIYKKEKEKVKAIALGNYTFAKDKYKKDNVYEFDYCRVFNYYSKNLKIIETENFIDVADYGWHQVNFQDLFKLVKNTGSVKMLKIENVVLINGQRADELEEDRIIQLIRDEKACLSKIDELQLSNSKAVKKIAYRHEQYIKKLVKVLDSRYNDELDDK